MYQAFILLCTINVDPSFEDCFLETSNYIFRTEEGCIEDVEERIEKLPEELFKNYYIEKASCHSYLSEFKT